MSEDLFKMYVKKPVKVTAVQWDGTVEHATRIIDFILQNGGTADYRDEIEGEMHIESDLFGISRKYSETIPEHIAIDTLEGTMRADKFDYIICGIEGEFYPCKPNIFQNSYDTPVHRIMTVRVPTPGKRGDDN